MEALAIVSTFSSSSSLSSTAPRPHRRLLTSPASGRSTRTLLPPPRAVSSSRAPLVVSHSPPAPVVAPHAKVDHSGRFCSPRSARELALSLLQDDILRAMTGGHRCGTALRPQGHREKRCMLHPSVRGEGADRGGVKGRSRGEANYIRRGDADVMAAGSAETALIPIGDGGFVTCRALPWRNDVPRTTSSPWDQDRHGFVMSAACRVTIIYFFSTICSYIK